LQDVLEQDEAVGPSTELVTSRDGS